MRQDKDKTQRALLKYNEIFADIVNALVYRGEQRVRPEQLTDLSERDVIQGLGQVFGVERDNLKQWGNKAGIRLCLMGMELQSSSDPLMPLRVMGYEYASHAWQQRQIKQERRAARTLGNKNKDDIPKRPVRVVTLVIYLGLEPWHGPQWLSECVDTPDDELGKIASDYKIQVFDIGALPRETIDRFQSDFKLLADLVWKKRRSQPGEPYSITEEFKVDYPGESVRAFMAMAKDFGEDLERLKEELILNLNGEKTSMKDVWQQDMDRAEARGKAQGEVQGKARGKAGLMRIISQLISKIRQAGKDAQELNDALEQEDENKLKALCRQYNVDMSALSGA
ncbi:MAG: Rpn family recombination-promoting nuclease/putative transposase [Succinivibrio sp.]|nr:Rpn family recombination-promoting nuclease/putative transposase [Succinivibrio sp.]